MSTPLQTAQAIIDAGEKATPSPWAVHPIMAQIDAMGTPPIPVCQMLWPTDLRSEAETLANARFITLSHQSPDVARALISAVEQIECLIIGGCAVGVPHAGERKVLHDVIISARLPRQARERLTHGFRIPPHPHHHRPITAT